MVPQRTRCNGPSLVGEGRDNVSLTRQVMESKYLLTVVRFSTGASSRQYFHAFLAGVPRARILAPKAVVRPAPPAASLPTIVLLSNGLARGSNADQRNVFKVEGK